MNALERSKIAALSQIRIPPFGYGARLLLNLRWRLENEPDAPLSREEKYQLELCCWHYRRKLGGLVDFELPTVAPEREHYFPPRVDTQERLL